MFKQFKVNEKFTVAAPPVVEVTLDRIIANNPVTEDLCKPLQLPPETVAFLSDAWLSCTEDVNLKGFTVEREYFESCEGLLVLLVKYDGHRIDVGVAVYDEEDEPEIVLWAGQLHPAEWTPERLKKMWIRTEPVETIKITEKTILPNSPCPCGSEKKFKKCHGRF